MGAQKVPLGVSPFFTAKGGLMLKTKIETHEDFTETQSPSYFT
jgi:hypothetical protein